MKGKGSKLDEPQAAAVLGLLAEHDAIAEYYAIDMSLHPNDVIDEFKQRQAAAITANLTPEHAEAVVRRLHEDAEGIRRMANPLFVQAFVSIQLSLDMLDVAINYYAQRRPSELGQFAWTIDRKDRTVTEMEQLWSTLMLPMGESRSSWHPYAKVEGFDYTHFAKYEIDETTAEEKMSRHLKWMRETLPSSTPRTGPLRCIDAKKVWTEKRVFEDSKNSLGLQLADIAATTLCRALNGNLQPPGWKPLSRLLIRKKTASFLQLGKAARSQHPPLDPHAEKVCRTLDAKSQAMVLETGPLVTQDPTQKDPMQESIEDLMTEIRGRVQSLESSLPRRVDPMAVSPTAKLPFKALSYRETLIWRMAELSQSACESFEKDKLASAILLTRAAVETGAALWYLYTKLDASLAAKSVGDIDDYLMRLMLGSKSDSTARQAINVLSFVDRVEKDIEGFRHQYDLLSEFSHPNWAGTTGLYSRVDLENLWTDFGSNLSDSDGPKHVGVINLSVALGMFERSYNRIGDILPAFITLCESQLKTTDVDPGDA